MVGPCRECRWRETDERTPAKLSKTGSTRSSVPRAGESGDAFLSPFHASPRRRFVIVKAMEMEQTMNEIEAELMRERGPESSRLASGCFHADEDFAVVKSDNIGWAADSHKAAMELTHSAIGDEEDVNFLHTR